MGLRETITQSADLGRETLRTLKAKLMEDLESPKPEDLGSGLAAEVAEKIKKRKKEQESYLE
jgi:hypothetical protein